MIVEKFNSFSSLPDSARVWVYQSDKQLSSEQRKIVADIVSSFLQEWNAHGNKLFAAGDVLFDRFVVLAVDEKKAEASGCSIDSSVRMIKKAGDQTGIDFFNRLNIAFLQEDGIKTMHFREVKEAYEEGELTEDSVVFDNTVETLEDLKKSWMLPLKDSPARTALLS